MVGRFVSTRLFAGVVFSSIQLLILVVGFTYQADAEARCRGGSCRVQRFAPFQRFAPVQRFQSVQPMRCSGRSCGQPMVSSCGSRGCGMQPAGSCGMRRVCGANGCTMVSSCGVGRLCGPNGCSTQVGGSLCGPNGCTVGSVGSVGRSCSTCGVNGCSTGACSTQGLNGVSPVHAGAASLLGIGNEALSRGVSSGLGALQDQGTVQACNGGVNWYNRARGNWEPANICLSVNNQQLPIILSANGALQLADQAGNLEPLSDNHSRSLASTYRKNGVQHQFMDALLQRYPEETPAAVAQDDSAAPQIAGPQPAEQPSRNPASSLSETASTQAADTKKPTLVDLVLGTKNSDGTVQLDADRSAQAMVARKAEIMAALKAGGRGPVTLMFSGATCKPCVNLKAAIEHPSSSNQKLLQHHKIDPAQERLIVAIDHTVVPLISDLELRNALMPYADENSESFVASVPHIFGN